MGTAFGYRTGSKAQISLVAPAARFVERDHGPLTTYDETQLRVYYRSIPDMQHPTQVFGRASLVDPRSLARTYAALPFSLV